jgi:alpha-L-fucosidase 2
VTEYRRQLDMNTGVARVSYAANHVHYTREIFASHPDQIIVMRLAADHPGQISFRVSMDRPEDFAVRVAGTDRLILREGPSHKGQIRFAGEVLVLPTGGKLHSDGKEIVVDSADSVVLLIAAATDFKGGPFAGGNPEAQCAQVLALARTKSFDTLLKSHLADHEALYRRTALHLGPAADPLSSLPTDERLKRVAAGADDLHLQELYFQFARYLLIGSSRSGGLPANLQGLWASGIDNPWGSKWTINVNTEMNYWLAEPADLGQTTAPLFDLIDMVRTPGSGTGQRVAQQYYRSRGFVIHHNTDLWGDAEPIDIYQSGIWPMGGAWLSLDVWDHYAYTGDRQFLRNRAWPILHEASLFFLDYLVPDGSGHLVTGPSLSPENQYRLPDGTSHSLTMAPTMDIEILRELFTRTLQAGKLLQEDSEFLHQVEQARDKLPPFKIGKLGQLQEWQQDYDENDPGHRHISHLWALFPGTQISVRDTPELARAARITLERRLAHGGGQTGWSRAWVVNYWDHLGEGEQAYDSLQVLFRQSTFPNLMDTHPPGVFQIDGNLGAAAGMLEALLQSRWNPEAAEIDFLPALPPAWSEGSVTDVRVRGGAAVDLTWKAGKAVRAVLRSSVDAHLRLCPPRGQTIASIRNGAGASVQLASDSTLSARKGRAYTIQFR